MPTRRVISWGHQVQGIHESPDQKRALSTGVYNTRNEEPKQDLDLLVGQREEEIKVPSLEEMLHALNNHSSSLTTYADDFVEVSNSDYVLDLQPVKEDIYQPSQEVLEIREAIASNVPSFYTLNDAISSEIVEESTSNISTLVGLSSHASEDLDESAISTGYPPIQEAIVLNEMTQAADNDLIFVEPPSSNSSPAPKATKTEESALPTAPVTSEEDTDTKSASVAVPKEALPLGSLSSPVPQESLPLGSLSTPPAQTPKEIMQLKNLHSQEILKFEQDVRRLTNENELLSQRLSTAEKTLSSQQQSRSDLLKQISRLTKEKKAYEEQVRFWKNKANAVEKEITDSIAAEKSKMQEQLEMSNKKLKLMKTGHTRKTTEMQIKIRRLEEKETAERENTELPEEVTELQTLLANTRLEMRMKDAENKVLQERLVEYKSQIQYKEVAENLQTEINEMHEEIKLVHESKKRIIQTLTGEIDTLRRVMDAYMSRPSVEDIRVGLIKSYQFARATAIDVHGKLFTPNNSSGTTSTSR